MRAFHDEDEDYKLDRSIIGIPKEGWAISSVEGPVKSESDLTFAKAAFAITDAPATLTLRLRY